MPPVRLVLDSNSYFRLACSTRPLLATPFGEEPCRLSVLRELDDEFARSPRLQSKFFWIREAEYEQDRRRCLLPVSRQQKRDIELAFGFILHHEALENSGVSLVDVRVLAAAHVVGCKAVTDDQDMRKAAAELGIGTLSTLELLKRMLDCQRVDMALIRQIVEYWASENDLPAHCREDYVRLFGEAMP